MLIKLKLALLLIVGIIVSTRCQTKSNGLETDWEKLELVGNPISMKYKTYVKGLGDKDDRRSADVEYEFNKSGFIIKESDRKSDMVTTYQYNCDGYLISSITKSPNYDDVIGETKYSKDYRIKKTMSSENPDISLMEEHLDENGNTIETLFFHDNGAPKERYVTPYDKHNRLISTTIYDSPNKDDNWRIKLTFTYQGDNDKPSEMSQMLPTNPGGNTRNFYDSHNNLIKSYTTYGMDNTLKVDSFVLSYDRLGNWTRREQYEYFSPSKYTDNRVMSYLYQREIVYK